MQVLDSYQRKTYADGQASAVYGQFPPQVNASRPPDSGKSTPIFHGPLSTAAGKFPKTGATPNRLSNGVLVQDKRLKSRSTGHHMRPRLRTAGRKKPSAYPYTTTTTGSLPTMIWIPTKLN